MSETFRNQKRMDLMGKSASVWKFTVTDKGLVFKGILLDNNFFIPINGGKSSVPEYNLMAGDNVREIPDVPNPVEKSFILSGFLQHGTQGGIISGYDSLLGIFGIRIETDDSQKIRDAYPNIKIEPVFS